MTEEQVKNIQLINDNLQQLMEKVRPIIEKVQEVYEKVKDIFINIWENVKKLLCKDITIAKKQKKGKRIVYSLKKIKLYELLVQKE